MEEADPRPDTHDRAANLDLDRRRARTGIRHHRNEVGSLRIGRGDRIANRHRSELPAPVIELIAMQPVAQRDLARLRTRRPALRHNRGLLRRAPTSPSWCPTQHFNATETVPINWQITWHTIPLPRSNKAGSPHRTHPVQRANHAPLTIEIRRWARFRVDSCPSPESARTTRLRRVEMWRHRRNGM